MNTSDKEISILQAPIQYLKRARREKIHPIRSDFERDRDRLLYNKAFRRLAGKTQVFLSFSHDYIRNRMTHTLEVAQIARTIARHLGLDEILTEAIALGHDFGHTPFGHVGERILHEIMCGCLDVVPHYYHSIEVNKGFRHNLQSLRVVNSILRIYQHFSGLNLCNYTLWGISNHTNWYYIHQNKVCKDFVKGICYRYRREQKCQCNGITGLDFYDQYRNLINIETTNDNLEAWSFEGMAVRIADEIAQRHHDLEDALLTNIMKNQEIIGEMNLLFDSHPDKSTKYLFVSLCNNRGLTSSAFMPYLSRFIINTLVTDVILTSQDNINKFINKYNLTNSKDFIEYYPSVNYIDVKDIISYSPEMRVKEEGLAKLLDNRLLQSSQVQRMDETGKHIIQNIFQAFTSNPKQLPDRTISYLMRAYYISEKNHPPEDEITFDKIGTWRNSIDKLQRDNKEFQQVLLRTICDHIAGMTDNYAIHEYQQLYGNNPFRK